MPMTALKQDGVFMSCLAEIVKDSGEDAIPRGLGQLL